MYIKKTDPPSLLTTMSVKTKNPVVENAQTKSEKDAVIEPREEILQVSYHFP